MRSPNSAFSSIRWAECSTASSVRASAASVTIFVYGSGLRRKQAAAFAHLQQAESNTTASEDFQAKVPVEIASAIVYALFEVADATRSTKRD